MRGSALRWLLPLCAALAAVPAGAQESFGQNKVQYHAFHWSYYQTEHFDIYFPQGGETMARFAASHVEKMYARASAVVGHKLFARVPIILHNTHAEFEQTNVINEPLDEGIGGFTERFKNRIVLPFEGNYTEFYHVLQHELTHAVVFDMLFGGPGGGSAARQFGEGFPLWVNEGLAEYVSLGWDLGSEFFMIDATTFGYVAPPSQDFGGYLAYKGGQMFFHFLDTVYGKGTTTRFIHNLAADDNLPRAFQKTTHTSIEEAGEIWLRELRYLYWPELGQRQYGKSEARKLTNHGRDQSFYNLQPSISPDGKEIAFFSDRESWEAIYILNVKTEKTVRAVIQSGKKGSEESFHSFKSGIAWSPDGKQLAIVSKQGGRDVIHLIDAKGGAVRRVLTPGVQAVLSPSWSRDGKKIAFSGQKDGLTDIYVYDLAADSARRLTNDIAHDDKPVFSPSGKWIAFESDRPRAQMPPLPGGPLAWYDSLLAYTDIYRISVDGDSLARVAGGPWDEKMPAYGPSDSLLIFVSNRSGLDNIYLSKDSAGTQTQRPITNLLTGCFTPSWSYDGKELAFSLFEAGGWDVYLMKDPLDKVMKDSLPKTRFIRSREDTAVGFFRPPVWANLSSYKPDTAKADSGKGKSDKTGKAGKKDSKPSLLADSAARDSLSAKSDSSARVGAVDSADKIAPARARDSLKTGPPLPAAARPADTAKAAPADSAQRDSVAADSAAHKKNSLSKTDGPKNSPFFSDSSRYMDANGDFTRRAYTPKWSFDAVSAAVGVDNYYGAGGLAFVTLSDLMGDQQLSFALSINGSLNNTNGYVQYSYLPNRIDYSVLAFHESEQASYLTFQSDTSQVFVDNATDHRYGFGLTASYPFSPYTRVEAGVLTRLTTRTAERDVYSPGDTLGYPDSVYHERTVVNAFIPTIAWVHDNAQWGIVGPVAGQRMLADIQYLPPLLQGNYSYVKADVDLRQYWEFFRKYTLAARISAGMSQAVGNYANPQSYAVGGESFTFNARANYNNLPSSLAEFYFSDLDFPLRGYDFYEFTGTRKLLGNLEWRFPFVNELAFAWPLAFSVTNVMGNLFVDWGGAWSSGNPLDQMGVGLGYGLRLNLGVFVLKYTYAQSIQGVADRHLGARYYWSLGSEF